ncbi:hypothetical protein [Gallibacterium anatis]|uniref:Uncharacterized protein n=1 Tax=Gallibacterium anatis TaxID=750 RepID=A0A1A7P7J6_9PAST|nr:hypothetical protein [Gallibacterium anatis]OBW97184.1 hypothetical protein QV02_01690 [Gallibacterium anatis]OBW99292.1 hypothetical protein QV03_03695 [Gallibacterium anatis]OZN49978.1 hypothetical protein CF595_01225 [Gallibacterium anatis]
MKIDKAMVAASNYYLFESALGYLGLCKFRPRSERIKLLTSAGRYRREAYRFGQLLKALNS